MVGAELSEFLLFLRQFGIAVAGAAALWGAIFSYRVHREPRKEKCLVYEWIAERLFAPFVIAIVIAAIGWASLFFLFPAYAHEGVVLTPTVAEREAAGTLTSPIFIAWVLFTLGGLMYRRKNPEGFHKKLGGFFLINFVFALVLASLPAWADIFDRRQLFFIGHSAHSIFTVGTVLILDFLFLLSRKSALLKQHLYPTFPLLSKVIWVGLGFDFLSVGLVFSEAIQLTPKFFFMQTVIGILIINGVLLSGPLARKLLRSVEEGGAAISQKWMAIADVAGTISIGSWLSITFVDFFENLTLSYIHFFLIYIGLIVVLFVGHQLWEHIAPKEPQLV